MIAVRPAELAGYGVRLEPLDFRHEQALAAAPADGKLWELWFTSVPSPADQFNYASQRAIEALGARRDGLIRHFSTRRDGSARDVVLYSVIASEWPRDQAAPDRAARSSRRERGTGLTKVSPGRTAFDQNWNCTPIE